MDSGQVNQDFRRQFHQVALSPLVCCSNLAATLCLTIPLVVFFIEFMFETLSFVKNFILEMIRKIRKK